jgi:hypothetical protein
MSLHYRQGDVLVVAVDAIPPSATPVPGQDGRLVLAEGEATGHAHAVASPHAILLSDEETDRRFLRLAADAVLGHEEHAPILLPAGSYEVRRQREYVPPAPPAEQRRSRRLATARYVQD